MVKSCVTSSVKRPRRTGAAISVVLRIALLSLSKVPLTTRASIFARSTESISQALNQKRDTQLVSLEGKLFRHSFIGAGRSLPVSSYSLDCVHARLCVETLPALELLLAHVEQAKAQLTEEDTH